MSNPYPDLIEQLNSAITVDGGQGFENSLNAAEIVLGLSMLLAALTALIRRRNGQLSFYTFETVGSKRVFRPCGLGVFLVLFFIFCALTQMFVVHLRTMSSTFGVRDQSNLVYFRSTCFSPLWIAHWSLAWSATIQVLSNRTTGQTNRSGFLVRYVNFLTGFFLVVPIVFFVSTMIVTSQANIQWTRAYGVYQQLDAGLTQANLLFIANKPIDSVALLTLENELISNLTQMADKWQVLWYVAFGFLILELGIFLASTIACLRITAATTARLRQERSAVSNIRRSIVEFRTLLASIIAVTLLIGLFSFFVMFFAVRMRDIILFPSIAEKLALGAIFTLSVGGFLAISTVFALSFNWNYVDADKSVAYAIDTTQHSRESTSTILSFHGTGRKGFTREIELDAYLGPENDRKFRTPEPQPFSYE